jgi:hypothetical protein
VGRPYRIGKLPGAISSTGFPGADASGTGSGSSANASLRQGLNDVKRKLEHGWDKARRKQRAPTNKFTNGLRTLRRCNMETLLALRNKIN